LKVPCGPSVKLAGSSGNQIEYENQDPRIHEIFLKNLAQNGVESKMGNIFDESRYKKTA
jgi:hypothetical protein